MSSMNVKLENLKYRSILLSHSRQASQQHKEQKQEWNQTTASAECNL